MSENRAGSHEMCMSPTRGGGQAEAESAAVVGTSVVDLKSRSRSSSALSFPCSLKKSLVYCSRNYTYMCAFCSGIFCLFVFLLETLTQQSGDRISPIGRSAGLTVNVVLFESLVLQITKLLASILVNFFQSLILFTNLSEFKVDSCQ